MHSHRHYLFLIFLLNVCVCMRARVCNIHAVTHRVQRRKTDTLELELQAIVSHVVWVLRPELYSSEKAPSALEH